jgi:hypothetical protein
MKVREREIEMKLVREMFRWIFICLGSGAMTFAATLYMGLRLPYSIAAGLATLAGVLATILWRTNRRKRDDWYDVATDVSLLMLVGSVVVFFVGAYFGAGWWMIYASVGGMIAAFAVVLVGLKAFPKPEE